MQFHSVPLNSVASTLNDFTTVGWIVSAICNIIPMRIVFGGHSSWWSTIGLDDSKSEGSLEQTHYFDKLL